MEQPVVHGSQRKDATGEPADLRKHGHVSVYAYIALEAIAVALEETLSRCHAIHGIVDVSGLPDLRGALTEVYQEVDTIHTQWSGVLSAAEQSWNENNDDEGGDDSAAAVGHLTGELVCRCSKAVSLLDSVDPLLRRLARAVPAGEKDALLAGNHVLDNTLRDAVDLQAQVLSLQDAMLVAQAQSRLDAPSADEARGLTPTVALGEQR